MTEVTEPTTGPMATGPITAATAATGAATAAATAAVPFDPFADDDDYDDTVGLKVDSSTRSRNEALTTFRQRRGTHRNQRAVADGMVLLPFVQPTDPELALITPGDDYDPPVLKQGDVVAGQYEVLGVLAHGGLGWIYLANDRNVSGRVVVLKGLASSLADHDRAVADAEREFLADITHPGIIKIFNFIDDPRGDLIVMEYAPGPSLRDRRRDGTIAPDIAIGYILEVLPALDYLHSRGVVYNDLKPDNIIITEDQVKLIDLGAVSGIGAFGYIYGTKGFQAPEVSQEGPSVASDIYTVGRTLASLICDLPMEHGAYSPGIPSPTEEPLFGRYLSLYQLLLRATDPKPERRFRNVRELQTQLYGVLREILAVRDGRQFPAQYSLFSPQRTTFGTKHTVFRTDQLIDGIARTVRITPPEIVAALPVPLLDTTDPGAQLLSGASYVDPQETLETIRSAIDEYPTSTEIPLGMVRALLDLGLTSEARTMLNDLERLNHNWRHQWYSGVTALLLDDYNSAQEHFSNVLNILPGESAPKLALAVIDELLLQQAGFDQTPLLDAATIAAARALEPPATPTKETSNIDPSWTHLTRDPAALRFHAMSLYNLVWSTNPTTISSAFGLTRMLMAEGQLEQAVGVLDSVPQPSRHQRMAKLTTILHLVSGPADQLTEQRIRRAARRLEEIPTNEPRFLQIKIAVMNAALNWLRATELDCAASTDDLFDFPFTQRGLRRGIAKGLRLQARSSPFARHRYALVDMANTVRPTTWF